MKLQEMFPEISLNPASAKDIKQWILQLAVEGKLTKKWREENTNIKIDAKYLSELKINVISQNSTLPFALPESWKWTKFGELNHEIHYGFTASALNSFNDVGLLRITDIQNNYVNWSTVPDCIISEKEYEKYQLKENDILIARTGGTIGKSFLIKGINRKAVFASYLIRAIPKNNINSEYLKLSIETPFYWKQLVEFSKGTGQPNVNATSLKSLLTPLPPLEEQQAIVSIVESLFKEVDELAAQAKQRIELKRSYAVAALNRLCEADTATEWQQIAKVFPEIFNDKQTIKTLRETILQLAVQGKLTAKWRLSSLEGGLKEGDISNSKEGLEGGEISSLESDDSDEYQTPSEGGLKEGDKQTAHDLLTQIKAEKAQLIKEKKIKAEKPLPAIEADEIPFELPEGWVWCRLGEVTNYGNCPKVEPSKLDKNTWVLDLEDIEKESSRLLKKHTFEERKSLSTKNVFNAGDVLYSKLRPYLDKIIVADENGVCTTEILPIKVFGNINPEYLKYTMKSRKFLDYVNSVTKGMKMPRLGTFEGKMSIVPVTNLKEQQIIVEKVNALMGLCDELEKGVEGLEKNEDLLKMVLGYK